MKIGIVGAGRVGCALAIGLKEKGFDISGIYSRSEKSAELLNIRLGTAFVNELAGTVENSDIVFITLPDDELYSMANSIAGLVRVLKGKTFFHCSGASTSDVLLPLEQCGASTGSLHPVQTFADRENGWRGIFNIYFGFEGCRESGITAQAIVSALGGKMLVVSRENKALYHAAACIISNYAVTLSYMAWNLLDIAGVDRDQGLKAFSLLMEKAVDNIRDLGSVGALTGPISRGDLKTVENHIREMREKAPQLVGIYAALGMETVELALKKGTIDGQTAGLLNKTLGNS